MSLLSSELGRRSTRPNGEEVRGGLQGRSSGRDTEIERDETGPFRIETIVDEDGKGWNDFLNQREEEPQEYRKVCFGQSGGQNVQ